MAHLMADGRPCSVKDGHKGHHRSLEAAERRRESDRLRSDRNTPELRRQYYLTHRERWLGPDGYSSKYAESHPAERYDSHQRSTARRRARHIAAQFDVDISGITERVAVGQ